MLRWRLGSASVCEPYYVLFPNHSVKEFEDISIGVGMADGIREYLRKELSKSLLDRPLFNVGQTSANLERSK